MDTDDERLVKLNCQARRLLPVRPARPRVSLVRGWAGPDDAQAARPLNQSAMPIADCSLTDLMLPRLKTWGATRRHGRTVCLPGLEWRGIWRRLLDRVDFPSSRGSQEAQIPSLGDDQLRARYVRGWPGADRSMAACASLRGTRQTLLVAAHPGRLHVRRFLWAPPFSRERTCYDPDVCWGRGRTI
jgi:hypothetical protein